MCISSIRQSRTLDRVVDTRSREAWGFCQYLFWIDPVTAIKVPTKYTRVSKTSAVIVILKESKGSTGCAAAIWNMWVEGHVGERYLILDCTRATRVLPSQWLLVKERIIKKPWDRWDDTWEEGNRS
jgi:hypothetical protein